MKKLSFILMPAALLIAGCQKEYVAPVQEYMISAEAPATTKTDLNNATVTWSDEDAIKVWGQEAYSTEYVYTIHSGQGTSSATFTASSGTDENSIIAIYPASSAEYHTQIYKKCDCPTSATQTYVPGGIQTNLMVMAGVGSPTSLQFKATCCVLRLNVRSSVSKMLDYITVTSDSPLQSRHFWDTRKWSPNPVSFTNILSYVINYNVDSELGTSDVEYNIVTDYGTLSNLVFFFYAADGTVAVLEKTSDLVTESGHIYTFPSTELIFASPDKKISYDGGAWEDWPNDGVLSIPTVSIAAKTGTGAFLNEDDLESIKNAVGNASSAINVDLSMSSYNVLQFPAIFRTCKKLKNFKLPYNITKIADYALMYTSIDTLYFGSEITYAGDMISCGAYKLKYVVDSDNESFSSDISGALYNKDKTKLCFASDSVTKKTYTIPSTVTKIGDYAFCYNGTIETLTIPSTVSEIGSSSLYDCPKLSTINALATTPQQVNWKINATGRAASNRIINVPAGCLAAYQTAWSAFTTCLYPYTFVAPLTAPAGATLGSLTDD